MCETDGMIDHRLSCTSSYTAQVLQQKGRPACISRGPAFRTQLVTIQIEYGT
jgi:hypothetical protein